MDDDLIKEIGGNVYQCSRCLFSLFTDMNIINSAKKDLQNLSVKNLWRFQRPCAATCRYHSSINIEPMQWMLRVSYVIKQDSGNLHCPKCNYRIGEWSWSKNAKCKRERCRSGRAPRFQITRSRIAVVTYCNNISLS